MDIVAVLVVFTLHIATKIAGRLVTIDNGWSVWLLSTTVGHGLSTCLSTPSHERWSCASPSVRFTFTLRSCCPPDRWNGPLMSVLLSWPGLQVAVRVFPEGLITGRVPSCYLNDAGHSGFSRNPRLPAVVALEAASRSSFTPADLRLLIQCLETSFTDCSSSGE